MGLKGKVNIQLAAIVSDVLALVSIWLEDLGRGVKEAGVLNKLGLGEHHSDATAGAATVLCTLAAIWITYTWMLSLRMSLKLLRLSKTVPCVKGGWPVLGQAPKLANGAPWDVMTAWAKEYGSIYRFKIFGKENVVVSDPAYMKEVMRNKVTKYHKDIETAYRPFLSLLGTGIVTSDGKKWRRQRNKVSSAFRIEVLSEVPGMAQRAVARLAKKLDKEAERGGSVEIGEEMRHLTLQVISEALMSLSPEEADGTFATVYMPIVVEGHKRTWNPLRRFFPLLPAWWAHIENQRILNDYITGIIRRRWDSAQETVHRATDAPDGNGVSIGAGNGSGKGSEGFPKRKRDVLDKVLDSVEPGEWGKATMLQIRDEMKTFVLAGHETSASMLNWTLFELTQNNDLMAKVLHESEQVFGPNASLTGPLPSVEKLRGLQFTEACLREALRKYSLVPLVVRRCVEDTTICGDDGEEHFIPKGCPVHLMIKGVHERPDLWPEPMRYDPSRFEKTIAPYTFLPFIDGPRNCLGQHLSLLESKVVLSLLVNRYKFSLLNENAAEPNAWIIPTISKHGTHLAPELRAAS